MAFYTTLEEIGRTMTDHRAAFWKVYNSNNEKVGEQMKLGMPPEESYSKLCDFINGGNGDWVTVMVYTKPPNKTETGESRTGNVAGQNKFTYRVLLSPSSQNSPIRGISGGDGMS